MSTLFRAMAMFSLSLCAFGALGQDPAPSAACCTLADGTIIELEIAEPLSTKTAQRGQRFKLRLATPLYAGETLVLPAGIEGVGEIVHADRARAAGKPGELLLAARTLSGPDGEIKLRGFKFGGSGENRTTAAFWIPLGFFVRGGQVEVPVGARAHAKLSGAHTFSGAAAAASGATPPGVAPATPDATVVAPSSPDPARDTAPANGGADTPQPRP